MADQPAKVNAVAQFFGTVIKAAILGGEAAAEAAIGASLPFLELPFLAPVTNWLVRQIGDAVRLQVTDLVTMAVIDVQTNLEESSALAAAQALQKAQESGDPDAIANASKEAILAYQRLVNGDGSYTPR